jgi:uncharacterized membrane protein
VLNRWFFVAFFGTAAGCGLLIVTSLWTWPEPGAIYHIIGGALYLVGTILVTIVFNVPRKNALAVVDPASAEGATLWSRYLTEWTAWNHVRTVAALSAAGSLTVGLCSMIQERGERPDSAFLSTSRVRVLKFPLK